MVVLAHTLFLRCNNSRTPYSALISQICYRVAYAINNTTKYSCCCGISSSNRTVMKVFPGWSCFSLNSRLIIAALSLSFLVFSPVAEAETSARYASKQRQVAAAGYYARARTMLVEALSEFEQGRKYARPDVVIDSEEFRLTLISLTEQLNRLVEPRMRVSRDGLQVRANPRLIRREKERLPVVKEAAQDSNVHAEEKQRALKQLTAINRDLVQSRQVKSREETRQPEVQAPAGRQIEQPTVEPSLDLADVEEQLPLEDGAEPEFPQNDNSLVENSDADELTRQNSGENQVVEEFDEQSIVEEAPVDDQQISAAIDQAIQERLQALQAEEESLQSVE